MRLSSAGVVREGRAMTEVEKLRALLAEARGWVAPGSAVRSRIDAALAEPVANDFQRGAEAMREAIYLQLKCPPYDGCNDGRREEHCDSCETADMISEIPIPEDK